MELKYHTLLIFDKFIKLKTNQKDTDLKPIEFQSKGKKNTLKN